jgi:hypothetical protein
LTLIGGARGAPAEAGRRRKCAAFVVSGLQLRLGMRPANLTVEPPITMPPVLTTGNLVPDVVEVPARTVLAIDGGGGPDGEPFARALAALRAVGGALQVQRGALDSRFALGPLEVRWSLGPPGAPRETWRWRQRLAIPDDVNAVEVVAAADRSRGARAAGVEIERVWLEHVPAGPMARVLLAGPAGDAAKRRSFAGLRAVAERRGALAASHHLEVRLDDSKILLFVDLL